MHRHQESLIGSGSLVDPRGFGLAVKAAYSVKETLDLLSIRQNNLPMRWSTAAT